MAFDADDLSPHEHFVVDRTRAGEVADFSPMAGAAGAKPVVRAGFLRKLMLGLDENWGVRAPGVRLKGARIEGALDLTDCSGLPALALERCELPEPLALTNASLERLSLRDCAISAIQAANLKLSGPLDLSGVAPIAAGESAWVSAPGAFIRGDLTASGAKLVAQTPRAPSEIPPGQSRYALDLHKCIIEGAALLVDDFAAQGGVNFESARVDGGLTCRGATLVAGEGAALRARGTSFGDTVNLGEGFLVSGEVQFEGALIDGDLLLGQSRFEAAALSLDLSNADIRGGVRGALKAEGGIRLAGAVIASNLDLRTAEIGGRKFGAAPLQGALDAPGLKVGGAMLLQGVNVKGEVFLADARIGGYCAFGGGRFINAGGWAIRAPNLRVGGNLTLKIDETGLAPHGQKTVIEGGAKFDRARIDGALAWLNLELRGPGPDGAKGGVFSFADAEISGALEARGLVTHQEARIDASGARCAALADDVKTGWGADTATLALDGFAYGRIDSEDETRKARLAWLKRGQRTHFSAQPYVQLAGAYARAGKRDDARRVALAQHDAQTARGASGPITWSLSSLFGLIAGYGFAPLRAVRALVLFLGLGVAGVFAMNAQGALVDPQGRACNSAVEPALYAIDVALPVIDLGQQSQCAPGRTARAELPQGMALGESDWRLFEGVALWRWAHALYAMLGAILAALAVLTFSGVMKPRED